MMMVTIWLSLVSSCPGTYIETSDHVLICSYIIRQSWVTVRIMSISHHQIGVRLYSAFSGYRKQGYVRQLVYLF